MAAKGFGVAFVLLVVALVSCSPAPQTPIVTPTLYQFLTVTGASSLPEPTSVETEPATLPPLQPGIPSSSSVPEQPYVAGKWRLANNTNSSNDDVTSTLYVEKDGGNVVLAGGPIALVLRCPPDHKLIVLIHQFPPVVDDPAHVAAKLRFDKDTAEPVIMKITDNFDGLEFQDPTIFVQTLQQHDSLVWGLENNDISYTFDLRGLSDAKAKLSACGL